MNHSLIHKSLGLVILAGVVLAFTSTSEAAERTRSRSGSYTTGAGKSGTLKKDTTRANGTRETNASRTNQDGATASRSTERTWDKETGTGTTSATATRINGKTATREGTLTKTDAGTINAQGTATGFNGRTGTYDATITKTETGRTTTGTVTGENGKNRYRQFVHHTQRRRSHHPRHCHYRTQRKNHGARALPSGKRRRHRHTHRRDHQARRHHGNAHANIHAREGTCRESLSRIFRTHSLRRSTRRPALHRRRFNFFARLRRRLLSHDVP